MNKFNIDPYKIKSVSRKTPSSYLFTYFLPLGLALLAPADDFLPAFGAAFFALAFVAMTILFFSPSQWSGTLSVS